MYSSVYAMYAKEHFRYSYKNSNNENVPLYTSKQIIEYIAIYNSVTSV